MSDGPLVSRSIIRAGGDPKARYTSAREGDVCVRKIEARHV